MSGTNKFPFTASQWQELEHQALIFKYMVSGIPIPSDLLFTIKRSCLDSPFSSKLFPRQNSHGNPSRSLFSSVSTNFFINICFCFAFAVGWSCFQMGLGRKIDPEPGRCRRTDGKKWRCSKEAYPDSKYCERHMHRGKNRSRKPVEIATQTATVNPSITPTVSSITKSHSTLSTPPSHSLSLLSSESHQNHLHQSGYHSHLNHHFLSSHAASRPPGNFLSPDEKSTPLLFNSGGSCSLSNTDYRFFSLFLISFWLFS